jgi:hypothetical protein
MKQRVDRSFELALQMWCGFIWRASCSHVPIWKYLLQTDQPASRRRINAEELMKCLCVRLSANDKAKTYEVDGLPSAGGVIGDIKVQMQICVGTDKRVI